MVEHRRSGWNITSIKVLAETVLTFFHCLGELLLSRMSPPEPLVSCPGKHQNNEQGQPDLKEFCFHAPILLHAL